MADDLKNYVKEHNQKEDSFVLCNIAGLEWQMLKDGNVLSAFPEYINKSNTMIASSNSDANDDVEVVKRMIVAIMKQNMYDSIEALKILVKEAGYEEFDIGMEYIIKQLQAPPEIEFC